MSHTIPDTAVPHRAPEAPGPVRIDYIDFAKGYAIFTVVLYHMLQRAPLEGMLKQAIVFGGTGIHLFFLLSGFGLAYSGRMMRPFDFYRRRLVRVWWPYVLALTISLAAALAFNIFPDRWGAWAAGVGLYQMFIEPYIQSFGGHFWFISAIIQLYLVFPVLTRLQRWSGSVFFLLMLGVSVLWWCVVFAFDKGGLRTWNGFFLQYLWEFALGMQLAVWLRTPERRWAAFWDWPLWVQVVAGGLFSALMVFLIVKFGAVGRIFNDIPALIGYGLLSAAVYRFSRLYWRPLGDFFLWINSFSYSLYLIHILVLEMYVRLVQPQTTAALLPFAAVALLCGRLYEPVSEAWSRLISK